MSQTDLLFIPEQKCGSFHLKPQYVSFKENKTPYQILKPEERAWVSSVHERPISKKEVLILQDLKGRYPQVPELNNLLAFFYLKLKKIRQAELLIVEGYEIYPDHLISKINYADYCLRKNQFKKIPTIFQKAFDLALLYPSREVFHLAEFRGFMTVMGFYHLRIALKDHAECYHYLARRVDPNHPAVLLLGRSLYRNSFFNKLACLFKK